MPVLDLLVVRRRFDTIQAVLRRIYSDVLPRSQERLDKSTESLSDSVTRRLESTQRLVDPEDD